MGDIAGKNGREKKRAKTGERGKNTSTYVCRSDFPTRRLTLSLRLNSFCFLRFSPSAAAAIFRLRGEAISSRRLKASLTSWAYLAADFCAHIIRFRPMMCSGTWTWGGHACRMTDGRKEVCGAGDCVNLWTGFLCRIAWQCRSLSPEIFIGNGSGQELRWASASFRTMRSPLRSAHYYMGFRPQARWADETCPDGSVYSSFMSWGAT